MTGSSLKDAVREILGADSAMAGALAKYELRPQQLTMAEAICDAIDAGKHLMVEAGTGVGKSLAYLVPFIIYAAENDKKVVVSTNTKTLQQQLCEKDLPLLKRCLGIDFNYALCVGSDNYVCLRRLRSDYTYTLFDSDQQLTDVKKVIEWAAATESGLVSGLGFKPAEGLWGRIARDPDLCMGNACNHKTECFYRKAKRFERAADILVTNHALFFANLASGWRVLPEFHAVVFDESHTLEDVASDYLGLTITSSKIKHLFDSICHEKTGKGAVTKFVPYKHKITAVKKSLKESRVACGALFEALAEKLDVKKGVKRLKEKNIVPDTAQGPLKKLVAALDALLENAGSEEDEKLVKSCAGRCKELAENISCTLAMEKAGHVYWFEASPRKNGMQYALRSAPVEISEELNARLFDRIKPIVLTSATLSTKGNFDFTGKRLGVKECDELLLDSPFDYRKNVLVYMPEGIADPSGDSGSFHGHVMEHIKGIMDVLNGRTFILFTSYYMLNVAYDELCRSRKDLKVLRQGGGSRYELLDTFKKNANSVLLGTDTFWQGVDVPGNALECVVITRLPFSVPDDPVTEARMELLASRGKNSFTEYQVPQATMMFRQGFGRLIRTKSDRGVVAILDPRVRTKRYGKIFLDSLPQCRHTSDINEVKAFFRADSAVECAVEKK